MENKGQEKVRQRVEDLLRRGFLSGQQDPLMHIGVPVPVMNPHDGQHSWFVPLEVGAKLIGFAQMLTTLEPLRFSSFQRVAGRSDECPDVVDWTDPNRILARAATLVKAGEQLSSPVLTYEQDPTRLAWKIEASSPTGGSRSLFVAGTAVYEGSTPRGWG